MAKRLEEAGWGIKYIDHVENRNKRKLEDRPWFNTTFSKLHVFNLQEYDKVQILKATVLTFENLWQIVYLNPKP